MAKNRIKPVEQKWGSKVYKVVRSEKINKIEIAVCVMAACMAINILLNLYYFFFEVLKWFVLT